MKLQLVNSLISITLWPCGVNCTEKFICRLPVFQQLLWQGSYVPYVQVDKASSLALKVSSLCALMN